MTLWLRTESLRVPASVAVRYGAPVVGGVATGAAGVELVPGQRYRARLKLSGLSVFASRSDLVKGFQKLGFVEISAWDKPGALPADWPPTEREPARSGSTWWAQGLYQGAPRRLDPAALEDDGVTFLWVAAVPQTSPAPTPSAPPIVAPPAPGSSPPAPPAPPAPEKPGTTPPKPSSAAADRHRWARGVVARGWAGVSPDRNPSAAELLLVQALCLHESDYGAAFPGHHNWGSMHAGGGKLAPGASCPLGSFPHTDKDAQGNTYTTCFRDAPTAEEAAGQVVRWLLSHARTAAALRAAQSPAAIAKAMREDGYFEAPASAYGLALDRRAHAITEALGEPWPFGASSSPASNPMMAEPPPVGAAVVALGSMFLLLFGRKV